LPIVWTGKRGSMALSCVSAKIVSSVGTGIRYGLSVVDTRARDHGILGFPFEMFFY
jgi:hypothetical protein